MTRNTETPKDMRRIRTGKRGEDIAVAHLQEVGYRIVARNYRCRYGEMDIIAQDGDTLVFIEVKSRQSERYGPPQEAVGAEKRKKLSRVSLHYLQQQGIEACKARFDVIAVRISPRGAAVDLIRDAFDMVL